MPMIPTSFRDFACAMAVWGVTAIWVICAGTARDKRS